MLNNLKKSIVTLGLLSSVGCSFMGPVTATSNPITPQTRSGEACYKTILFGLIPLTPDVNPTYDAATSAKITKISTVDQSYFTVLGLYNSKCAIVHGE